MGGKKHYLGNGGFSNQTFQEYGTVEGYKVLQNIQTGAVNTNPLFAGQSKIYVALDGKTHETVQISIYGKSHMKIADVDWRHDHSGKSIEGIHSHSYTKNGERGKQRFPTPEEVALAKTIQGKEVVRHVSKGS